MSGWGLLTISVAEAALPFPPSVDVTAEVVLFFVPMVVPVTCILKVQLLFALSDPPVNVSRLPPVITRLPLPHRELVGAVGCGHTRRQGVRKTDAVQWSKLIRIGNRKRQRRSATDKD